jgi:hypothetical protein
MSRFFKTAVPAILVCLIAGNVAHAQGRGGRGGRGGFGFGGQMPAIMLVQNAQVQKELKTTDEQNGKIKEIADASRPAEGAARPNFQEMTDEQRTAFREEMRKRGEENNKKVVAVLTADQNARLKQIQLQLQGIRALSENEEVIKELSISDEQKAAVKTIVEESGKKMQELRAGLGRGASEEDQKKVREQSASIRTETETEGLAQLTADQKAKFDTMKGEKFEMDMSALFGGRGRGGRGGRPGGNNN